MVTSPQDWPLVPPQLRPKPLFVNEFLSEEDLSLLKERGWDVQDVRLLPNSSMAERQRVVLAWLEGLRNGSIQAHPKIYDTLELEAKTCGLTQAKEPTEKPKSLDNATLDKILDMQSRRAFVKR